MGGAHGQMSLRVPGPEGWGDDRIRTMVMVALEYGRGRGANGVLGVGMHEWYGIRVEARDGCTRGLQWRGL